MNRYAIALAGTALFASAAWSQATAPIPPVQFMTTKPDARLASNIVGLDVYSKTNQNIGKIADMVLDRDSLSGYVLSVGGFLGIGERYVAVQAQSVAISYDASTKKWKANANATMEQLKNAPEFKYENKWKVLSGS